MDVIARTRSGRERGTEVTIDATTHLESELIDLSAVPLRALARLSGTDLDEAIRATLAAAVQGGDERQDQREDAGLRAARTARP